MTQEAYDAAIKGKEDPNKAREYNVDVEMKWSLHLYVQKVEKQIVMMQMVEM